MATAQVKELYASTGMRVMVVNRQGRLQWHEVFENNPKIVRAGEPVRNIVRLINASGARPYIEDKTPTQWHWRRWNITPGELFFTFKELDFGRPYAGCTLIEPNTKIDGSNKTWIWERWQALVDRGGDFVQVGVPGSRRLDGVRFVETVRFRDACAVLAQCRAFVGHEGGLHHAAAALGKPAVVLFSAFISPAVTGYPSHVNLYKGASGLGCGSRLPCQCCRASMEAITVTEVATNLEEILA